MELIAALGLRAHPLVVPAALIWCGLAALGWSRLRDRRARGGGPPPTWWSLLFVCVLGCLLALTLTPSRIGLGLAPDAHHARWCWPQLPRTGFGLWAPNRERRWNVILTVPLGLAAAGWFLARVRPRRWPERERRGPGRGQAGRGRGQAGRGRGAVPVLPAALAPVVALGVPSMVELVQAVVPGLGRVCAVVDVVDNVSGVLLGFACALPVVAGAAVLRPGPRRRPAGDPAGSLTHGRAVPEEEGHDDR